jgi:CBS-domain-containing membrane protein
VTAHPDETLRALANRMAQHDVTRLLVVTRGERPRVEGIISLRHLLAARRIDLHEETSRRTCPVPAVTAHARTGIGDDLIHSPLLTIG